MGSLPDESACAGVEGRLLEVASRPRDVRSCGQEPPTLGLLGLLAVGYPLWTVGIVGGMGVPRSFDIASYVMVGGALAIWGLKTIWKRARVE